ncbi:MAG: hypothetical protein OJF49_002912 [Ktedonobacterales bacterium]|nr:MAG: hypothetical protein OJF49_002912 [Ktedonobacterales bacterium]
MEGRGARAAHTCDASPHDESHERRQRENVSHGRCAPAWRDVHYLMREM